MERRINEAVVHYEEHGDGVPLVALHGAGVDHRDVQAAIETVIPREGYRRIYPDLPGMGRSTTHGLTGNDDVVALLCEFIGEVSDDPVMLLGHSYGGYLARGVAAQRPDLVRGLALLCTVGEGTGAVPDHEVVVQDPDAYDELDPSLRAGFDEYFVVRTAVSARRYCDHVAPGVALVDQDALGRVFARWTVDVGSQPFQAPTLIAAGRRDSVAGYAGPAALLEHYPRATVAVIENAGHALMHERPDLFGALLGDWLQRAHSGGT
jgi:pimeloyl-ACP methyl ester carboxylesterase